MTQYNDALIECTNCVCSNSYSLLGGGGAILSTSNGNVTLINSTISNVTALETSGITYGACTVSSLSWTYLINLVISNCINEYGGAIYNSGYLYASNITVSNSTAIYGGGVLYNDLGGVADIVNSSFCNNTATSFQGNGGGYGGAIFSTGLTSLSNVVISNNTAVYGGGIYTTATAADTLVTSIGIYQLFTNNILYLNDSVLIAGNNASADGGGLYMDGISKIHIGFSNLTVTNNNANGFGNAMYLNQEESNGMNGGVVVSSSASSSGGLVAIVNGTVHVRDVNFGEMLRRQGIVSKLSLSKFEGSNAKVSFLNESQILSLNNSMLDTSGIIPGN